MGVDEEMVKVVFGPLNFSYGLCALIFLGYSTLTDTDKHTHPQIELKTSLLIQGAFMTVV